MAGHFHNNVDPLFTLLQLYRVVVRSANAVHAIMPEYVMARGFVDPADARQDNN